MTSPPPATAIPASVLDRANAVFADRLAERHAQGRAGIPERERLADLLRAQGREEEAAAVLAAAVAAGPVPEKLAALDRILAGRAGPRARGDLVPAAFVHERRAFGRALMDEVLADLSARRATLAPAVSVYGEVRTRGVDPTFRDGLSAPLDGPLGERLDRMILEAIAARLGRFGLARFEPHRVLRHYGLYLNGHLGCHQDGAHAPVMTAVYYFWREPRAFDGGDILLFDDDRAAAGPAAQATRLRPEPDSLVLFPSDSWHAVEPVRSASADPLDGRLSVVFWITGAATWL